MLMLANYLVGGARVLFSRGLRLFGPLKIVSRAGPLCFRVSWLSRVPSAQAFVFVCICRLLLMLVCRGSGACRLRLDVAFSVWHDDQA